MKIIKRIKTGKLSGWTIRKSKHGWYDLYSYNGISQTQGKNTIDEIYRIIKIKKNSNHMKEEQALQEANFHIKKLEELVFAKDGVILELRRKLKEHTSSSSGGEKGCRIREAIS